MSLTYTIKNQQGQYFITCTVNQWVDVFTRNEYKEILLDSLRHCQKEKGLNIYAWVLMSNHIHLIVSSRQGNLSDIIRDFKKFTSTKIVEAIGANTKESRKRWLLWLLSQKDKTVFWQESYHGEEIISQQFFFPAVLLLQGLCGIRLNPSVKYNPPEIVKYHSCFQKPMQINALTDPTNFSLNR
jgi:REP element-mobilizing transposase RayT